MNAEEILSQVSTQSARIYDVREKEEWDAGHLKDAILLPLSDIESGIFPNIAKNVQIYMYCRSGGRVEKAIEILKNAGYQNMTNIGGYEDLKMAGFTYEE